MLHRLSELVLFTCLLLATNAASQNAGGTMNLDPMERKANEEVQAVTWELVPRLKEQAVSGDAHAQMILGLLIESEKFEGLKDQHPIVWLIPAAEHGEAVAQFHLVGYYISGSGVPQSLEKSIYWCRKAADSGHLFAQTTLGGKYRLGLGVAKSGREAEKWWKRAAEAGFPPAQLMLAGLYKDGFDDVPADPLEAEKWTRLAAEHGYEPAKASLGESMLGPQGVPTDPTRAETLFRETADKGDVYAQYRLGMMCKRGTGAGGKIDLREALHWLQQSADLGYAPAQVELGKMHAEGDGVTQSWELALDWYRKAAEAGLGYGMYRVGGMYEDGLGTPKNPVEAFKWYSIAAGLEFPHAAEARDALLPKMAPAELSQARAEADQWMNAHPWQMEHNKGGRYTYLVAR